MPGAKPPASIVSDEASRPTGAEAGERLSAAATAEGDAMPVGSWETEDMACPHDGQYRLPSGTGAWHCGQTITLRNRIRVRSAPWDNSAQSLRDNYSADLTSKKKLCPAIAAFF